MKNKNYIIREKEGRIFNSQDKGQKIKIKELLENNYPYINDSIKENNYSIRLNECDQFKELLFNQKVVGFVTYNKLNKSTKLLTNVYIILGYRRNKIFTEEIKKQYKQSNQINIYEPNKLMIDTLIKLGYAKQFSNTLLISAINFNMQLKTALTNNNEETPEKLKITNLYDMNICATVSFKIFAKNKYTVYYTQMQEQDRNKCQIARNNIDDNYFDDIVTTLITKDAEIQRWLYLLRHNLPQKQVDLEEFIGTQDKLPEIFKEKLENNQITEKEITTIQNQLKMELRLNQIDEETISLRLHYLAENIHNKKPVKTSNQAVCHYCYEEKPFLEHYCTTCGYKFFDINTINDEEFVYKYLLEHKQGYKNSLTGKQELKGHIEEKHRITLAMCDVIKLTNECDLSFEIFLEKARKYKITHINLEDLMLKNNYVTFNMNPEKWEMEAKEYSNNELKNILREYNCKVSGNKYELIQRIKKEVPLEDIESDIVECTEKGINFFNDNFIIQFFHEYLYDYIYTEFLDFINNKKYEDNEILEDTILFLQKHVDMAHETKNHDQLIDALSLQSKTYMYLQKPHKFLENEIKIIILNLNMYYIEPQYYSYYKPVSKMSWDRLFEFKNMFTSDEISDTIMEVYNTFEQNRLIVKNYDMMNVFDDIFKHHSYTGLNGWIQRKYYYKSYKRNRDVNMKKSNDITTLDKFL